MSTWESWTILIVLTVLAGVVGFACGRRAAGGSQQLQEQAELYEQQLAQKQAELDAYQQKVHNHYDKTAGIFKDMAGSYKELFDHLSSGYEKLGNPSENRILPERAGALLDGPEQAKAPDFMNASDKDEDAITR